MALSSSGLQHLQCFSRQKRLLWRNQVFAIASGRFQYLQSSELHANQGELNAGGIATALANAVYAQPLSAAFQNPKNFGGGIPQMTLGIKFVF
jgi:hypothetical protein